MADLTKLQQLVYHRHRYITLFGTEGGRWFATLTDQGGRQHYAEGATVEETCAALWERWREALEGGGD